MCTVSGRAPLVGFAFLELEFANLHQGLAANELSRAESKFPFVSKAQFRTVLSDLLDLLPPLEECQPTSPVCALFPGLVAGPISWYKNKTGKRKGLEEKRRNGWKKKIKREASLAGGGKGGSK